MTKKADRKTSRVEGIIEYIIGKSPHSKEIITAFKPLFLAKERLIDELNLKSIDPSSIDGEKLRQGIPCINQTPFFLPGDPWEKIGCAVISAIREGFPALGEDAAKIEGKMKAGDIRLFDALNRQARAPASGQVGDRLLQHVGFGRHQKHAPARGQDVRPRELTRQLPPPPGRREP